MGQFERSRLFAVGLILAFTALRTAGAQPAVSDKATSGPEVFQTAEHDVRVVEIAAGLESPWSIAFLPDGDVLVTERAGRLRIIRGGVLDPEPIAGVPEVYAYRLEGLLDIALHPRFAENRFVYLSYSKPGPALAAGGDKLSNHVTQSPGSGKGATKTVALARGRWSGEELTEVRDIFVADDWIDDSISTTSASRLVFGRDGMLYMTVGAPNAPGARGGPYADARGGRAQDPASHGGKVLRLRDDGTAPKDNPFVGKAGYEPEIYTLGHRNALGLTVHPETGAIWEHENGPQDGDEVNVLKPGANYGWPLVGMGRDYSGDFIGGPNAIGQVAGRADASNMHIEGIEQPLIFWAPAVAPSGMTFYTGDKFPKWQGNLFVGVMKGRRLEREVLSDGRLMRREFLLEDLHQRIRDVREGPDGLLYLLTDGTSGALLRLEPAE